MTMQILIIEDNERLANLLCGELQRQQFNVDVAFNGQDGEQKALQRDYDAIVLDLLLPDHDGVELCRNLRRAGKKTPVLMLTALGATHEKVTGLDAGADDYMTKPFELDELNARLRALLRRAESGADTRLRYDDVEMDLLSREVTRSGRPIHLTSKEFALLEYFMRNAERVLSRENIADQVWDVPAGDSSNVIEVYVSRLRGKLDRGFSRSLIHTVVGSGYVMRAPADAEAEAPEPTLQA